MNLNAQDQAVLLLTAVLGKEEPSRAQPLSTQEWARFAHWLHRNRLEPAALLKGERAQLLADWTDRTVTLPRLQELLERGGALGFALEKWQRAGLWIMTRADPRYPKRFKRHLKQSAPPVLFGCGNPQLLNGGGLAVVGSRKATPENLAFAENFGQRAAQQGYAIVSGGAQGVDQSAMQGALQRDGAVVGILANGLLRAATEARYRPFLLSGALALVSPFNPEAGFNVGHAMARNRYIYCLADAGVVVCSEVDRGGTWRGALEVLKARWVPLWVQRTEEHRAGNAALAQRGAQWLPEAFEALDFLRQAAPPAAGETLEPDLFALAPSEDPPSAAVAEANRPAATSRDAPSAIPPRQEDLQGATTDAALPENLDLYGLFLYRFSELTADDALKHTQVAKKLGIDNKQSRVWLQRGVEEGEIEELQKPVRYRWAHKKETRIALFR